jgi:hypothetical protein
MTAREKKQQVGREGKKTEEEKVAITSSEK